MIKLTAIIPAYNEELAIGSIVIGSKKHVDRVIVIDDGSVDNTVEIAQLAGADVISHETNKGKGIALKTGLLAARNSDIIITLDSDGQHNYDEIPKLIAPIINGEADIVNGSRYLNGDKKDTPKYRRVGQTVLDKATKISSGFDITDSQSGFRAFARHTIPAFRFKCNGFGIESEMLMDAANAGLRIKEVEIGVRYDLDGSTKNPVTHGFGVLMNIINDLEFQRPLLFFTLPGVIICIIGITLGLIFFGDYLSHSISISGVPYASKSLMPTILAIMLTLGGGFLALTGIILDSMSKMIKHVLNNPNSNVGTSNIRPDIKIETSQDLTLKTGK
ncbi:glycosyltransferase family 2 protein [Methanobacterium oryzae]|uniref:glycosyltransferase family 2 protein n=1 Tax=Methanobacterium oryzae TaxID=69540 RepID=UPI003D1A99BD